MKALIKFRAWLPKAKFAIVNNSVYQWLCYRLNIRVAIALVVLLNLATVVSDHWFDWTLNIALSLVGYLDYKGHLDDRD